MCVFFFFKQKTAYEMRISDWSSDVCSSDLSESAEQPLRHGRRPHSRQEVFLGRGNAEPDKTKLQRGQRGGQPQGNETGFSNHFVPVSTLCVFSLYCMPSSSRGM